MQYDRDDSFQIDFESNDIPFGILATKENYHQDHIPLNLIGNVNLFDISLNLLL